MKRILLIEDDLTFQTMLSTWLKRKGFEVDTSTTAGKGTALIERGQYDLILCDMRLPDGSGLEVIEQVNTLTSRPPVIVMTGYADVPGAVNAMKSGATDYISKPIQPAALLEKIEEAIAKGSGTPAEKGSRTVKKADGTEGYIEGESEASRRLYSLVDLVAPTPMSVLITGPNGSGKEHVARRIHDRSKRASGPFVAIDCGALTKELAASELFGHVKGAFTGALADKRGAFVEADGGTLFLDEIGNLGYEVQVQLLRAIQERRIRPVGATKETSVDVRIVCATNANPADEIKAGRFREDLYHRLNEFGIKMPSLSERGDDIMLYATFFLERACEELDRNVEGFTSRARELMLGYSWPGNLRQLKNAVKRATLLAQGNKIDAEDLGIAPTPAETDEVPLTLRDPDDERRRIVNAIKAAAGNKAAAARMLGIDRKTLYNKLRFYDL